MFVGESKTLLAGAPHYGRLLACPTNIRLGWKGLPWRNNLSYKENSQITDVRPGTNIMKLQLLLIFVCL
jgi:hypothetical protein